MQRVVRPAASSGLGLAAAPTLQQAPIASLDGELVHTQYTWLANSKTVELGGTACTVELDHPRVPLGEPVYAEVQIELRAGESMGPLMPTQASTGTQGLSYMLLGQEEPTVVLFQPRSCNEVPQVPDDALIHVHKRELEHVRLWELSSSEEPVALPRVSPVEPTPPTPVEDPPGGN